jgi:diaminopimelate epimerase
LEVTAADGEKRKFHATLVSFGNPHAVIFVDSDLAAIDVATWGPLLERHPSFPDRTNVEFVSVVGASAVKARVWERGSFFSDY